MFFHREISTCSTIQQLFIPRKFDQQVTKVHEVVYQTFGTALEKNKIGKLKRIVPTKSTVDISFQKIIDSRPVKVEQYKGKVLEIHQVAMMNMSGIKLLRKAQVVSGVEDELSNGATSKNSELAKANDDDEVLEVFSGTAGDIITQHIPSLLGGRVCV